MKLWGGHKRIEKTVTVRVFSKIQKEALIYISVQVLTYPKVIGKTKNTIDYQIDFDFSTNYYGWLKEYKWLSFEEKFKILTTK